MNTRLIVAAICMPLPSFLKRPLYRALFGYTIGADVKIGFSILSVSRCVLGRRAHIGHFNYIADVETFEMGADARVGFGNIILGGSCFHMGEGAIIDRFNEVNAIRNPIAKTQPESKLEIGVRAVITASHKIDYTDRVVIGDNVVIAGRLSNIWTHNRQQVAPVEIGRNCYVGSGVQMAPGSSLGDHCVVGMGSIVTKAFPEAFKLIAGVPARVVKDVDGESMDLVTNSTRPDLDRLAEMNLGGR